MSSIIEMLHNKLIKCKIGNIWVAAHGQDKIGQENHGMVNQVRTIYSWYLWLCLGSPERKNGDPISKTKDEYAEHEEGRLGWIRCGPDPSRFLKSMKKTVFSLLCVEMVAVRSFPWHGGR